MTCEKALKQIESFMNALNTCHVCGCELVPLRYLPTCEDDNHWCYDEDFELMEDAVTKTHQALETLKKQLLRKKKSNGRTKES
jgi:hypothetical protein